MAKSYFIINTGRTNAEGRSPINLRICDKAKVKTYATGFTATADEWDGKGFKQGKGVRKFSVQRREEGGVKEYTNADANAELVKFKDKADTILKRYDEGHVDWSMAMFEQEFKNKRTDNNFLAYAKSRVKTYQDNGQWNTASILEAALSDLETFEKGLAKLEIKDIDKAFVRRYIAKCNGRGDKPNTISIRLRAIRAVLNYAIQDKVGSRSTYPFGGKDNDGVKIPSENQTRTTNFVPTAWMEKMAATPMDNPTMEEARHLFLFMFFAAGINYADAAKLTSKNIDWIMMEDGTSEQVIRYTRSKTHKVIEVHVTDNVRRELDWFRDNCALVGDHLLPIINGKEPAADKWTEYVHQRRKRFNGQIQKVAKALEFPEAIQDLGSYTARHSFAMALRHQGTADAIITQTLGHEDARTTRNYFDRFGNVEMKKAADIDITVKNKA
jgi:site-specific recombinase XerD